MWSTGAAGRKTTLPGIIRCPECDSGEDVPSAGGCFGTKRVDKASDVSRNTERTNATTLVNQVVPPCVARKMGAPWGIKDGETLGLRPEPHQGLCPWTPDKLFTSDPGSSVRSTVPGTAPAAVRRHPSSGLSIPRCGF